MLNEYVLITTEHRGVFFGKLTEESGDVVTLQEARCAIRWATTGGFLELAKKGPNANSKVGDEAPEIILRDVTSTTRCTPEAVEAWKSPSLK